MIPLLLNDIPLLIGRIVIFRLDNINNPQSPTLGLSPTLPLTRQLSYFFLMKNLLVVVLSVGNMYLHCKDQRWPKLNPLDKSQLTSLIRIAVAKMLNARQI